MESFAQLGLSEGVLKTLRRKGFEEPTPIQVKSIPIILKGDKDVVGQAQTGTGKTAAFGLPIIELMDERPGHIQTLVLTPTRELAIQVAEEISSLKGKKKLRVLPIYGGQSMDLQLRGLKKGVDVVVGTPGRVLDHIKRRTLKLGGVSFLVLDEADEMLNMGFLEDVEEIIKKTGSERRTFLFSATMSPEIMRIAKKYMGDYEVLRTDKGQLTVKQTDQIYFEVSAANKFEALCRIIDIEEEFYGLVFCRTKIDADTTANRMAERGYDADALHGDLSQNQREKILGKFKKKLLNILVATDVAARGIDVHNLTHVINYSLPQNPEYYIHRIGRTGRAGKEGNAITFITPEEYRKLEFIRRSVKTNIRKARLPKVKDVIASKKIRIKADIKRIVDAGPAKGCVRMAEELLRHHEPEEMLAALLQYSFQDELDEKSYKEIEDAVGVDKKGTTRLFVKQGKKDALTPKKLAGFIQNKCGLKAAKIRDVLILDKFSFVTLPFHEAEMLLSLLRRQKKRGGPIITKANKVRKKG